MVTAHSQEEIGVFIVDDHPVVRAGLRMWLDGRDGICVVDEAPDGDAALARVAEILPDVVLVDLQVSQVDAMAVADQLRQRSLATRPILFTGTLDAHAVTHGMKSGICGFVSKTAGLECIDRVIRHVYEGEFVVSPDLLSQFGESSADSPLFASLLPREREMFVQLASGASLKQAAIRLQVTYKAADHLKQSVMKKLGVHDRIELVRLAIREGITN
jgi:DNA-binding NarL/FixJ family response regulator